MSSELTNHVPLSCQNTSTCLRDDRECISTLNHWLTYPVSLHNKVKIYPDRLRTFSNHIEGGGAGLLCWHVVVTSISHTIRWQDLIEDAACVFHDLPIFPWVSMQLDSHSLTPIVPTALHNAKFFKSEILSFHSFQHILRPHLTIFATNQSSVYFKFTSRAINFSTEFEFSYKCTSYTFLCSSSQQVYVRIDSRTRSRNQNPGGLRSFWFTSAVLPCSEFEQPPTSTLFNLTPFVIIALDPMLGVISVSLL